MQGEFSMNFTCMRPIFDNSVYSHNLSDENGLCLYTKFSMHFLCPLLCEKEILKQKCLFPGGKMETTLHMADFVRIRMQGAS